MILSTPIITQMIDSVNESTSFDSECIAVNAYEISTLPLPISTVYLSFFCEENKVSFHTDSDSLKYKINDITIRMTCFSPLNRPACLSTNLAERVLSFFALSMGNNMTETTVGEISYDDDVKAYKTICRIRYSHLTYDAT